MAGNGWKLMEWMEMGGNCGGLMEMAGNGWNGCKGCKWREMAVNAWYSCK